MQNKVQETVTQSTNEGISTIAKESSTDTQTQTLANIVYFIAGLFEISLLFRLVLKMTGANPGSGFVSAIYSFTQLLMLPFRSIFPVTTTTEVGIRAVFEPATLVAMLVYAVVAWGVVRLIAILAGQSSQEL